MSGTLSCIFVAVFVACVSGNGRLLVPPQRSSLWRLPEYYMNRFVFKNYDDHTLDCGGYWVMCSKHFLITTRNTHF